MITPLRRQNASLIHLYFIQMSIRLVLSVFLYWTRTKIGGLQLLLNKVWVTPYESYYMTRHTQIDTNPFQVRSNSNNFSQVSAERLKLRIVQTQAILFLKSMSERDGSDIKRLWIWMTNSSVEFDLIYKFIMLIKSRSMSDPFHSDIDFKNKMAWVLTALNLVRGRHFCLGTRTTGTWSFRGQGRSVKACFQRVWAYRNHFWRNI